MSISKEQKERWIEERNNQNAIREARRAAIGDESYKQLETAIRNAETFSEIMAEGIVYGYTPTIDLESLTEMRKALELLKKNFVHEPIPDHWMKDEDGDDDA